MAATDALSQALSDWSGVLQAPQEGRQAPGAVLAGLASGNNATLGLPDDRPFIGTAFEGTSLAAAAVLAVLWARGYAPVPLDLRLGPADLAARLRLARPGMVLAGPRMGSLVAAALAAADLTDVRVVELGDEPDTWRELPTARDVRPWRAGPGQRSPRGPAGRPRGCCCRGRTCCLRVGGRRGAGPDGAGSRAECAVVGPCERARGRAAGDGPLPAGTWCNCGASAKPILAIGPASARDVG